jgi:hypothetical protein
MTQIEHTPQHFWNIFYDDVIFDALVKNKKEDICPICNKEIDNWSGDECDGYYCSYYRKAYECLTELIFNEKSTKKYVFLDMNIVNHNFFSDERPLEYQKEMIIMLRTPCGAFTINTLKQKFLAVQNTLSKLSKHHFQKRSYYFEGIEKLSVNDIQKEYKKLLCSNKKYTDDSYEYEQIQLLKHFRMKCSSRDEYAEKSINKYINVVLNAESQNVEVYKVMWGS